MAYSHRDTDVSSNRLFILNGELRGVSVPLSEAAMRVGTDAGCDVILLDDDGDPAAINLSAEPDGSGKAADPVGEVRIGGRRLRAGKSRIIRRKVPISVGGVDMIAARSLAEADYFGRGYRRRRGGVTLAVSLAVIAGVIGVVGFAGGRGAVIAKPAAVDTPAYRAVNSGAFTPVVAEKALGEKLAESGLLRLKTSADRANRTVSVRGKLRVSEKDTWQDVSAWFDARYGASVQMDANLKEMADKVVLPFAVEAIWMTPSPRVTLHDGSKRRAGDDLPGGWFLEAISGNSLTISKDGETLTVPL